MPQKRLLFLAAQEIRLISESFGKSIVSKKIMCGASAWHVSFSGREPWRLAFGHRDPPARTLPPSLPSCDDPATASGQHHRSHRFGRASRGGYSACHRVARSVRVSLPVSLLPASSLISSLPVLPWRLP